MAARQHQQQSLKAWPPITPCQQQAHLRASIAQRFIMSLETTKGAQGARLMRHMLNLLASWNVSISLMQSAYAASSSSTSVSGGRPPGGRGGRGQGPAGQHAGCCGPADGQWWSHQLTGARWSCRASGRLLSTVHACCVLRRLPSRVKLMQWSAGQLCAVACGTRHGREHLSRAAAAGIMQRTSGCITSPCQARTLALSLAHDAAGGVEAHAYLPGRPYAVVQRDVVRVQVQVVTGCGAARHEQLSHSELGGDVHVVALQGGEEVGCGVRVGGQRMVVMLAGGLGERGGMEWIAGMLCC